MNTTDESTPPHAPRSVPWRALLGILLIALAARLAPILSLEHVSPDAVEFLDIAKSLRERGEPLLGVKAYFYDETPIVHYGGYERPLLPAVLLGLGHALSTSPVRGAQWIALAALLLGLLLLMLFVSRVYGWSAALASGLLVGLSPPLYIVSLHPWSETLSFFAIAATIALLSASPSRNPSRAFVDELLIGFGVALAIAMRPVNLLMLLPVGICVFQTRPSLPARVRGLLLLCVGPAIFFAIQAAINVQNGAPAMLLPQQFLYRVGAFDQGIISWEGRHIAPTAFAYISTHAIGIARTVAKQAIGYGFTLLFFHDWLFIWWIGLPIVATRLWRRALPPPVLAAIGIAVLNLLVYSLTWSTYDTTRFLLIPLILILPICIGEVFRAWGGIRLPLAGRRSVSLPRLLVLATVVMFGLLALRESYTSVRLHQSGHRFAPWAQPGYWNDPDLEGLGQWLDHQLSPEDAVASVFPWEIRHLTGRPAVYLPRDLDSPERLREFLKSYPIRAILFDAVSDDKNPVRAMLDHQPDSWSAYRVARFAVYLER